MPSINENLYPMELTADELCVLTEWIGNPDYKPWGIYVEAHRTLSEKLRENYDKLCRDDEEGKMEISRKRARGEIL